MSEGEDLKAYTLDEVSQHNTVEDLGLFTMEEYTISPNT